MNAFVSVEFKPSTSLGTQSKTAVQRCLNNNIANGRGPLSSGYWRRLVPKVVCSNPCTVYKMDIFSHLFVVKIVMCVRKDENK